MKTRRKEDEKTRRQDDSQLTDIHKVINGLYTPFDSPVMK